MKTAAEAKLPKQVRFARSKQPILQGAAAVRASGRNLLFAYIGILAALGDNVVTVYRQSVGLLANAQARGEHMEQSFRCHFQRVVDPYDTIPHLAAPPEVETIGHRRPSSASENTPDDLEIRVKDALANLGIPSRERLERLSQEIEHLTEKIDEELRKSDVAAPAHLAT